MSLQILIPVGNLKVIFSSENLSVCRMNSLFSREQLPVLDNSEILVGDIPDLNSIFIPEEESKKKKQQVSKATTKVSQSHEKVSPRVPSNSPEKPAVVTK